MAIECKLSTLMGENRYNIQFVCDHTGISRSTISTLYHDKIKRIDFETLDKLCELFDCEPGDIIVRGKMQK
jgi:putative transcriptional regulator